MTTDDDAPRPHEPEGVPDVGDAPPPAERQRRRVRRSRPVTQEEHEFREREERMTARIAAQWAMLREERRTAAAPAPMATGPSNFTRAEVPWGVDLAAAWGWRLLVIAAAGYLVFWLLGFFSVVTLPLAIALLLAALMSPVVGWLQRAGLPRSLSALTVVIGLLAVIVVLLTIAGQQVASGANDLADSTVQGLDEVKRWLKDGPLHASDSQIDTYIQRAQDAITDRTKEGDWFSRATEVGSAVGHVFAGFFIVLFSTYFFLADGDRIWAWIVRLSPRAARQQVDSSGRVAWISLTQFVRATVIVAAVDAIGIAIGAAVLQVPFVLAIGVLVFLGAFVPLIGATIAGIVAILVALVDQGPVTALIMLAVVVGVQQLEAHILQPFLMGRWVSVHPLAVIVSLAGGVLVGGIAGALVAVPLAAAANAVVQHLAANTSPGDDPVEQLEEDYESVGAADPVEDLDDER